MNTPYKLSEEKGEWLWLPSLSLISIKNFYNPNWLNAIRMKRIIDQNYRLYPPECEDYFNFPIRHHPHLFDKLYDKFLKTSVGIFGGFTLQDDSSSTCWAYRANKVDIERKRKYNRWHNHVKSSTINAVYYLDVVNTGISFLKDNIEYGYIPSNGELLIFPSHLVHAPDSNTLQKYRYSVNMEILTKEPSHQLFKKLFQ